MSPAIFEGFVPAEVHEHYDANDVYTGKTVVRRESEWDDDGRASALGLAAWEAMRCPSCRNYDTLVPIPTATRHVTWEEHGDRKAEVVQYRCITCGAIDVVRRDFTKKHEKKEPVPGHAAPADGRIFLAHPIDAEED